MAKTSLRRRRGTRSGRSNLPGLLQAIIAGIILVGVGLAVGLIVGLMVLPNALNNNVTNAETAQAGESKPMLRKPNTDVLNVEHIDKIRLSQDAMSRAHGSIRKSVDLHDSGSPGATALKNEFLAHTTVIGGSGPFPYYPDGGELVPEDFDFKTFKAKGGNRFEEWKNGDNVYVYQPGESDELARSRRFHVKKAMQFAWSNYKKYAFGKDELLPRSKRGHDNWGGMGTTLVDSLDTLWLMGMKEEFQEARDWVQSQLSHDRPRAVSVFETTIRSLGGLLSAYDWSGDATFLLQAKDLGKRLFHAFENPSGIPYGQVNLATGSTSNLGWTGGNAITAEAGTLQIEFRMLARLSGIEDYKTKSEKVFDILDEISRPDGLYPNFLRNRGHPEFGNDKVGILICMGLKHGSHYCIHTFTFNSMTAGYIWSDGRLVV